MSIKEIFDKAEKHKSRKRVGRGIGCGKGKTCGRGHKGQKARTGVAIKGFEGGQMPIHRRLPKRGFNNIFREEYVVINLAQIEEAVAKKKIKANDVVNSEKLYNSGLTNKKRSLVKILSKGDIKTALKFEVDAVSKLAEEKIKKSGGEVKKQAVNG